MRAARGKIKNSLILNFVAGLVYAVFYDFIFHNYIVALFKTPYFVMSTSHYVSYLALCGIPMLFYKGQKSMSTVFSLFTYILIYVPFIETLSVCGYGSDYNDYRAVFFISMCCFFITDKMSLLSSSFKTKVPISFQTFEMVSFGVLIFSVLVNVRNLNFVNILTQRDELYDSRSGLQVVGGKWMVYILFWLKNAMLPCLLVYYLLAKKYFKYAFAFLGMIAIFMIDMQKLTFVMPFIITALYFLYVRNKYFFINYFHLMIIAFLIIFPLVCYWFKDNPIVYEIAAIIIMRTQCIEGMILNTYLSFFGLTELHPYTYYSHIGIVNVLTGSYPYKDSLGIAVTSGGANANACFWLMDGIAAGGVIGVVFASILFIVVKAIFNGISKKYDLGICIMVFLFAIAAMINVSLFTSLLSCGLIVLYLIFAFVDLNSFKIGLERGI
ncbi:MAG: hypothetical protein AB2L20_09505 [Mangrovibacterium sp.]